MLSGHPGARSRSRSEGTGGPSGGLVPLGDSDDPVRDGFGTGGGTRHAHRSAQEPDYGVDATRTMRETSQVTKTRPRGGQAARRGNHPSGAAAAAVAYAAV